MSDRLPKIISDNIALLYQGLDLLTKIDDRTYDVSPAGFAPHRVGGHLRHCLEFYECFLAGIGNRFVDYDCRHRDPQVEHVREAALTRILETIDRLDSAELEDGDEAVLVRAEGEAESEPTMSSVARELGFLLSHTIHHFALVAMTLQALGVEVDASFGVSPSTLRYRAEAAACVR